MHLNSLANSTEETIIDNVTADTAEQISETKSEQQVLFDQRIIPTTTAYLDGSNNLPPPISMSESEFSHLDVLKQPIRLATAAWATTAPINTSLLAMEVPDILGAFPTIHLQLLQLYSFYKLTLRLRVVVNTTRFHAGKLIVFYDPFNTFGTGVDRQADIIAATGYPHVKLDAANSNSVEIDVPFENLVSFFTTGVAELAPPMGVLRILVFNPLQAAAGASDPITFNVFASAGEISMHVPTYPHVAFFSTPPTAKMNIKLSDITKTVGGVAKTVTGAIADVKSGNISGLFDKVKDFFSFDRPASIDTRQGNCLATISPPAHMLGLDQSVRLGASQDGAYTETDFSTAPASDQSIYEIIQKPMLVRQYQWNSADPVDTSYGSIPVTPGYCFQTTNVVGVSNLCHNTFLSFFTTMFAFWRGSIKYTIDFAATNFNTGRLMFAFVPASVNTPLPGVSLNVTGLSNCPHIIFDLEQHKEFSFTIPYVASTPRKVCVNGATALNVFPETSLGSLYILVVDPLTTTNNLPGTIAFNVYMSAGPDFRFYGPRISPNTFFSEDYVAPPDVERITMNGDTTPDSVMRETQTAPCIIKGAPTVDSPEYFGEEIRDVRDLCRRYTRYQTSITMTADPNRTGVVIGKSDFGAHPDLYYAANPISNIPRASLSFSTMIARTYVFWSGSIRWKFVPITDRTKNLQLSATFDFNAIGSKTTNALNYDAFPQFIVNSSQDSGLEIELPFYTHFTHLLAQDDPAATAYPQSIYTPGYVQLEASSYADNFTSNDVNITAYHACGNDIAFRMLISPPSTIEYSNILY